MAFHPKRRPAFATLPGWAGGFPLKMHSERITTKKLPYIWEIPCELVGALRRSRPVGAGLQGSSITGSGRSCLISINSFPHFGWVLFSIDIENTVTGGLPGWKYSSIKPSTKFHSLCLSKKNLPVSTPLEIAAM